MDAMRFLVTCADARRPDRRFARVFEAVCAAEALRLASVALDAEPVDYYVVSVEPVS